MKNRLALGAILGAAAVIVTVATLAMSNPPSGIAPAGDMAAYTTPIELVTEATPDMTPLSFADGVVNYNTAGDSVYASLVITDTGGSGVLLAATDGGVFTALPPSSAVADGGVALGNSDGSGCITASATAGTFTTSSTNPCGAGDYLARACIGSLNSGNTGLTARGAWSRTRAGTTTQLTPEVRKIETVDAGLTGPLGCVETTLSASMGDVFFFSIATGGATAGTHTVKEASLVMQKIRQ